MRRLLRVGFALPLMFGGPAAASGSANCYAAGNAELTGDKPRHDLAGAAFESAAAIDACALAAGRLYTSAGYAYRQQAQTSRDPIWYCKAATAWRAAIGHTRSQEMLVRLRDNLKADGEACPIPEGEAPAPGEPAMGTDNAPHGSAPTPAPTAAHAADTPPTEAPTGSTASGDDAEAPAAEDDDTVLWVTVGGVAAAAVAAGVTIWLLSGDAETRTVNRLDLELRALP